MLSSRHIIPLRSVTSQLANSVHTLVTEHSYNVQSEKHDADQETHAPGHAWGSDTSTGEAVVNLAPPT